MMHFDIKKLKDRVVKKVSKSFKKETRAYSAKSDDGVYDELPGSSKRSLKNNDENLHYDTPPPGVRPVNHPPPPPDLRPVPVREWKNTAEQEDPEREWYKTQDGPELWDTDDIMDIVLDELISESEQKQRPSSTVLIGEFDPKNFLSEIPETDTSGNELPPWKRMLMAKQVAEKAFTDRVEQRKREEQEARLRDMPLWKREIIRKKEEESSRLTAHVQ